MERGRRDEPEKDYSLPEPQPGPGNAGHQGGGKDYKRTTIRTFVLHLEEKGYVTTYQIGKYSYINYLIEEQDYKEQELEKTKNFWYKESGFDLVKTLYKGKLNEGKLKKLKKLLEEIDD